MSLSWTSFSNGDTLATIRGILNSFNSSVEVDVNKNTTDIASQGALISTNTADIASTVAATAANTSNVATNTASITDLEDVHNTFAYSSADGSSTTSSTYAPLNSVQILGAEAGVYQMLATVIFTYTTTQRSAYFRASLDGGTTWLEFRREIKDITDVNLSTQMCVITHTGGDIDVQLEFKTEADGDTLSILKNCITLDRKN